MLELQASHLSCFRTVFYIDKNVAVLHSTLHVCMGVTAVL